MHATLLHYDFDWLINLDASDYPLVKQDDLLFVLSHIPRHLNFIDHAKDSSMEQRYVRKVVTVLKHPAGTMAFEAEENLRLGPYRLYTGSPWMVVTCNFLEFCVKEWHKGPQKLLLQYHASTGYTKASYFQTIICNSLDSRRTLVNSDLRFAAWRTTLQAHPGVITIQDYKFLMISGAPFASKFSVEGSLEALDWIDRKILVRHPNMLVPGGWCAGSLNGTSDGCLGVGNITNLLPGPDAERLLKFFKQLMMDDSDDSGAIPTTEAPTSSILSEVYQIFESVAREELNKFVREILSVALDAGGDLWLLGLSFLLNAVCLPVMLWILEVAERFR